MNTSTPLKTRLEQIKALNWPRIRMIVLLSLLGLSAAAFVWKVVIPWRTPKVPTKTFHAAQEAPKAESVPKHEIAVPVKVKAYDKAGIIKKLAIPAGVADGANEEVIATADVPASDGGHTSVTVLDTQTGDVHTVIQEKPAPLFALGGVTEVGARYGVTTRGGQQAALYARQDIIRIGTVHLAGYGEVNAGTAVPEAKAMVDVSIRW